MRGLSMMELKMVKVDYKINEKFSEVLAENFS